VLPWDYHKTALYKELGRIQSAAGLDPKRRDFKFHANRRSFVSFNWDLLGPEEVQRSTGHRSQSTTKRYRVYVDEHRESAPESFMPELPGDGKGHAC
jgi:integrase